MYMATFITIFVSISCCKKCKKNLVLVLYYDLLAWPAFHPLVWSKAVVSPTCLPLVSGRKRNTKMKKRKRRIAKGRKVKLPSLGISKVGKVRET